MAPVMVEVRGHFDNRLGVPSFGTLRFVPAVVGVSTSANILVPVSPVTVQLDAAGDFSVLLQATDDPAYSPVDWTYRVEILVGNVQWRPYNIFVPAADVGTGLDLADITPVGASPGDIVLVPGPQGPPGPPDWNISTITFSPDGTITDSGTQPSVTTFNTDGSITTAYGPPRSQTVLTTFDADGSITEALV